MSSSNRTTSDTATTSSATTSSASVPVPALCSWITPKDPDGEVDVDPLPDDKQKLYDLLNDYLSGLDNQQDTTAAAKKRTVAQKRITVLAMASLYTPMDGDKWTPWAKELSALKPGPQIAWRYTILFGQFVEILISICKVLPKFPTSWHLTKSYNRDGTAHRIRAAPYQATEGYHRRPTRIGR